MTDTVTAPVSEKFDAKKIDPFAPVNLSDVEYRGTPTGEKRVEIQRPDGTWTYIPGVSSIHSGQYKLVANKDVHQLGQETLEATGMQWNPIGRDEGIVWNGKNFAARWMSQDSSILGPDGKRMHLGFEVRNSYDGSSYVGFSFFAIRIACANQFRSHNLFGESFDFPHIFGRGYGNDIVIGTAAIKQRMDQFSRCLPVFQKLQDTPVGSFEDFLNLRKNLAESTGVAARDSQLFDELSGRGVTAEAGLDGSYDKPLNMWGLLNAYTAVTTHAVGGVRGAEQGRTITDWFIHNKAIRI